MIATAGDPPLDRYEREIEPLGDVDAIVEIPGSKSYTNRFIAIASLAALSGQPSTLRGALLSQDTVYLSKALEALGHIEVALDESANTIAVTPTGQPMRAPDDEVFMGNAGTPVRIFITLASLAEGRTVINGSARMQERPMGDLLEALGPLGVSTRALRGNGSPPIEIEGPSLIGGPTRIRGGVSSQFTTSLLISAPYASRDMELTIVDDLLSKPYVDMTVAALRQCHVEVERKDYSWFRVAAGQRYAGGDIVVEPDASGMSYFLAAAAVLGGKVRIPGIGIESVQGDVGLVHALVEMGCHASVQLNGITLEGGNLRGIAIDMNNMPDVVPTLAVVAAYATGRTHITGIGNLRLKECDRIDAVSTELRKMGVTVHTTADTMTIEGGVPPHGATINTYDDHRIAMSFAIAGLRTPGVIICDPGCVAKSFPTFWHKLDGLRRAS